jgi:hypothetical protein
VNMTLPSVAIAAALDADTTGDLAGHLHDSGVGYVLNASDLPRKPADRDRILRAAIPNRDSGRVNGTTRVRVTYGTPEGPETVDLDAIGVSGPVRGFGGAILVGYAEELPVVAIACSTIVSLEPLLASRSEVVVVEPLDAVRIDELEPVRADGWDDASAAHVCTPTDPCQNVPCPLDDAIGVTPPAGVDLSAGDPELEAAAREQLETAPPENELDEERSLAVAVSDALEETPPAVDEPAPWATDDLPIHTCRHRPVPIEGVLAVSRRACPRCQIDDAHLDTPRRAISDSPQA